MALSNQLLGSLLVLSLAPACAGGGTARDGGDGELGPAASIEVVVTPARSLYRRGQNVELEAVVLDRDGNRLDVTDFAWSVMPETAATPMGDGRFALDEEGTVVFRGCFVGGDGVELCDDAPILVDDGSPLLEVTSPSPADELGGDGATTISVRGSVSDTRDVTVFVNGMSVPIDDLGQFAGEVPAKLGVDHIDVTASDGVSDESRVEMDVLYGDGYLPSVSTEGLPSVELPFALGLDLGQQVFDDGAPLDPSSTPLSTGDLAGIVELVVSHLDLVGSLPDPLVDSSPTFFLRVTDVELGDVTVNIDVLDGGLALYLQVGNLFATTEGALDLDGAMLDLSGGVGASFSAYVRVSIAKPPDLPIEVSLEELVIALESATGQFVAPEANAVFALAEGVLRTTLETELHAAFEGTLADTLPALLSDALGALDGALANREIALPTGLFPPVTVLLDGRVESVVTSYRRGVRVSLGASLESDAAAVHPDSRGTIVLWSDPGDPFFASRSVQVGARVALLNGLLHTLYQSGILQIDATALLPDGVSGLVEEATLRGQLPPVVRAARAGEVGDLVVEVGQLELDLVALGESTTFGISLGAGISLDVSNNALSVGVDEEPTLRVWIIASETEMPVLDDVALRSLLLEQLWPALRDAVAGGLALELPALDVGGLASIAPTLDGFALSFEGQGPLDVREGAVMLDLRLVGTLP